MLLCLIFIAELRKQFFHASPNAVCITASNRWPTTLVAPTCCSLAAIEKPKCLPKTFKRPRWPWWRSSRRQDVELGLKSQLRRKCFLRKVISILASFLAHRSITYGEYRKIVTEVTIFLIVSVLLVVRSHIFVTVALLLTSFLMVAAFVLWPCSLCCFGENYWWSSQVW